MQDVGDRPTTINLKHDIVATVIHNIIVCGGSGDNKNNREPILTGAAYTLLLFGGGSATHEPVFAQLGLLLSCQPHSVAHGARFLSSPQARLS